MLYDLTGNAKFNKAASRTEVPRPISQLADKIVSTAILMFLRFNYSIGTTRYKNSFVVYALNNYQ